MRFYNQLYTTLKKCALTNYKAHAKNIQMENKTSLFKKLGDIIKANFSKEEQTLLADVATPPASTTTPVATAGEAKEFKTVDGISVFITGVSADGKIDPTTSSAYSDSTATTPVLDGTYSLDNGMTITVASGKVTEVSTPSEEAKDTAVGEEMKKMVAQMSAQNAKIEALEKLITKSNEAAVLLTKTVKTILDTPVEFKMSVEKEKVKRTFEDLSPVEKIKYRNGELEL